MENERERPEWPEADESGRADFEAPPTRPDETADGDDTWRGAEPEWPDEGVHPPPSEVEAYDRAPATGEQQTDATAAHSVPATGVGESTECPRCGTENRPGLSFCRNCGQRLMAAGIATTVQRPGTPEGTQACPRCGTHNRAGVAFCQNCGANLRGAAVAAGYVPPPVDAEAPAAAPARRGAVLGPVVLLIGAIGILTAWLLPFAYGAGSLFERAFGGDGYGIAFWDGYPNVAASLADQAYFGSAAPAPVLVTLLIVLAVAGLVRAVPGPAQMIGLGVALLWSAGLVILFVIVEVGGGWGGDLVALLRDLSPAGIIFFLASLIVLIGTLTRIGRG